MSENGQAFFLLSCFAEFYEAVAGIKLAIAEGRLPLLLRVGDQEPPTASADIAAFVSGQLAGVLRKQAARVARERAPGELKAYQIASYAMAALADEIFVLEVAWIGSEAWLDVLLEYKLFKSRCAGRHFFLLAQRLLDTHVRGPLHIDLACVLLMVLQLGFKGQYRGSLLEGELHGLRARLFALLGSDKGNDKRKGNGKQTSQGQEALERAFPQAYQNLVLSAEPARLAPLTPWYIAGGVAFLLYIAVSTVLWEHLTSPFIQAMGRG